jgi:hypothetical protein
MSHGSEITADDTGAVTATKNASIVVERAYVDMGFSKNVNARVGKSLSPTLWKASHYPNIVKTITEPYLIKDSTEIIKQGYTGLQFFGELGGGFNYNIWSGRSIADGTATDFNDAFSRMFRIAWSKNWSATQSMEVSYIFGTVETDNGSAGVTNNPYGADLRLQMDKFLLWAEYANEGTAANAKEGYYAIASYSMNVGGKQEISPFVMINSYKEPGRPTVTDSQVMSAVGVDFYPTATTVHKLEYSTTPHVAGYQDQGAGLANNTNDGQTWIKYEFAYFFN